jgi:hypothetical protein
MMHKVYLSFVKPVFHLAIFFAKTWKKADWLTTNNEEHHQPIIFELCLFARKTSPSGMTA